MSIFSIFGAGLIGGAGEGYMLAQQEKREDKIRAEEQRQEQIKLANQALANIQLQKQQDEAAMERTLVTQQGTREIEEMRLFGEKLQRAQDKYQASKAAFNAGVSDPSNLFFLSTSEYMTLFPNQELDESTGELFDAAGRFQIRGADNDRAGDNRNALRNYLQRVPFSRIITLAQNGDVQAQKMLDRAESGLLNAVSAYMTASVKGVSGQAGSAGANYPHIGKELHDEFANTGLSQKKINDIISKAISYNIQNSPLAFRVSQDNPNELEVVKISPQVASPEAVAIANRIASSTTGPTNGLPSDELNSKILAARFVEVANVIPDDNIEDKNVGDMADTINAGLRGYGVATRTDSNLYFNDVKTQDAVYGEIKNIYTLANSNAQYGQHGFNLVAGILNDIIPNQYLKLVDVDIMSTRNIGAAQQTRARNSSALGFRDLKQWDEYLDTQRGIVSSGATLKGLLEDGIELLESGDATGGISGTLISKIVGSKAQFNAFVGAFARDEDVGMVNKVYDAFNPSTFEEMDSKAKNEAVYKFISTQIVYTLARLMENPEGGGARLSAQDIEQMSNAMAQSMLVDPASAIEVMKYASAMSATNTEKSAYILSNPTERGVLAANIADSAIGRRRITARNRAGARQQVLDTINQFMPPDKQIKVEFTNIAGGSNVGI
jgi:hypothetical protein